MALPDQTFTGYNVKTGAFEGPLDLLLYLVRNYEINIYDIPIAIITEQFMGYLRLLKRLDLEIASEFIVMAAHLLFIKSRMLLPVEPDMDDEVEDPRNDLVKQLLEYQRFKQAAQMLEEQESISSEILERKPSQMTLAFPEDQDNWVEVKLFDLVNAFSKLISQHDREEPVFPILTDFEEDYDTEEKISQLVSLITIQRKLLFSEIISKSMPHGEIIVTFLALLHMIKRGLVSVRQHRLFGDIHIFLREDHLSQESRENSNTGESVDET